MTPSNIPTTIFNAKDVKNLKDAISQKGIVFEGQLIKAIEEIELSDGTILDPTGIIKRYADIVENAEKVNPKTGDMIPDHETRMKALDKLTKIMLGQAGTSK